MSSLPAPTVSNKDASDISSDYAYIVVRDSRSASDLPKDTNERKSRLHKVFSTSDTSKKDSKRLSLKLPDKSSNSLRESRRLSQPLLTSPRASIDSAPKNRKASPSSNPSAASSSSSSSEVSSSSSSSKSLKTSSLASMSHHIVRSKTPQARRSATDHKSSRKLKRSKSQNHTRSGEAELPSPDESEQHVSADDAKSSASPPAAAAEASAKPKAISPSNATPLLHDPMRKTSRVSAATMKAAQFKDVTVEEVSLRPSLSVCLSLSSEVGHLWACVSLFVVSLVAFEE